MLFNSIHFLAFLPVVVILYYALNYRYRWILLLTASYYFYASWKVEYLLLIIMSTFIDYYAAIQIHKHRDKPQTKKFFLFISLLSNLGILVFFKYFNFLGNSLHVLLSSTGFLLEIPYLDFLLPVGISFYTFQTLSYSIDVYRGDREAEKHLGIFALYVTFFPQLVAGPIERSTHFIPQLRQNNLLRQENISAGLKLIIWGFFMKLVIADRVSIYVNAVYNNVEYHDGITFLLATFFFAFQIYGDFAGYSFIAIGSARLMGYDLMTNFRRPYFAKNIKEFWGRWHISLSTWFRDYLYIPLGGNRTIKWRWYFNLFLTFLISGLWHGANWTFVIWGALHGLFLVTYTYLSSKNIKIPGLPSILLNFMLVGLAWMFFRANSVSDAFLILSEVFTNPGKIYIPSGPDVVTPFYAILGILALLIIEVNQEFNNGKVYLFDSKNENVRILAYSSMIVLIMLLGVFDGGQFIYFQF